MAQMLCNIQCNRDDKNNQKSDEKMKKKKNTTKETSTSIAHVHVHSHSDTVNDLILSHRQVKPSRRIMSCHRS